MSSKNLPKIVFKPYSFNFKLDDSGKVFKKLGDAVTELKNFKDLIKSGILFIQPFLNLIKANPLTLIIKTVKNYIQDVIQTFISSGFYMIIIHPWNQAGKRKKNFNLNLVSITNQIDKTKEGFSSVAFNSKIYKKIKDAETRKYKNRSDPVIVDTINKEIENLEKQLKPESHAKDWIDVVNYPLSILSYVDAIDEVIKSLDNTSDLNRPKWTTSNKIVGWGLIIGASDLSELVQKVSIFNKIFEFTNLSKDLFKFDKEMRSIIAKGVSKSRTNRINIAPIANESKNLLADIIDEEDKKKKLIKLSKFLYENTLDKPLKQTMSDSPYWTAFSIEQIPYLRQIRDKFFKYFDELLIVAESSDNIINLIVDAIIEKINWLISLIDEFNEILIFLQNLQFAIAGVSFTINEDLKYNEAGGIPVLKDSLNRIKSLDASLFDTSMKQEDISKHINDLQLSEYTTILFAAGGGTNGDLLKIQWDNFTDLLGYKLTKYFTEAKDKKKTNISDTDTDTDTDNEFDDINKVPLVVVNAELEIEVPESSELPIYPVLVEKDFELKIISNPYVQSLDFSLVSPTDSNFSEISSTYSELTYDNIITRELIDLPDNEMFKLTINYIGKNKKEYTKIVIFVTNFSLYNMIKKSSDSQSINNNQETGSPINTSITPVEGGLSIIEIPQTAGGTGIDEIIGTTGTEYASSILLTNTTENILYFSIGSGSENVYQNIPLLMGTSLSVDLIGSDGPYIIIIYNDKGEVILTKAMTKITTYAVVTQRTLDDINVYINSDSMTLLFPSTIGKYIFINNRLYELPAFIPLIVGEYTYFLIDSRGKYSEEKVLNLIQSSNLSGNNCLEVRSF
jgi:hypothetical protein